MTRRRYAMTVDTKRCVGCSACALACKAENHLDGSGLRCWVEIETEGTFPHLSQQVRSERCEHCDDPACVAVCPTGASYRADGGTVLVEHDRCVGCKACIAACPYDARYISHEGTADKCTFCLHRVREGKEPACVSNCPTGALAFGDRNDAQSEVAKLLAKRHVVRLDAERGLGGNLFFLD